MATLLLLLLLPTQAPAQSDRTFTSCPQVPTLHCRNGSTCIAGEAKFNEKDLAALSHLQTQESGYHCDCLPGYIGHECEIEVSACGGDDTEDGYDPTQVTVQRCYHGSSCRRNSNDDHYCDCESINALTASTGRKYAGLMCEHEATSMCAVSFIEEHAPNGQFCTNHGKCVKLVTDSDPHPGCVCREGWKGDRCELKSSVSSIPKLMGDDIEGGGSEVGKWVLFSILLMAMSAVAIAVIVLLIKIRREKNAPLEKSRGKTAAEVGLGDLEPDGSGTLGQDSENRGAESVGDLEMKENTDGAEEEIDNDEPIRDEDQIDSQDDTPAIV